MILAGKIFVFLISADSYLAGKFLPFLMWGDPGSTGYGDDVSAKGGVVRNRENLSISGGGRRDLGLSGVGVGIYLLWSGFHLSGMFLECMGGISMMLWESFRPLW